MSAAMGRRRTAHLELPPHMHVKVRGGSVRYYYGRAGIALGGDFPTALRKYADLHGAEARSGTFADAVRLYQREVLASKAPKTQDEYTRQLATLVKVFGPMDLSSIRPVDVQEFYSARAVKRVVNGKTVGGTITATREKAVLSLVFNFARGKGLTDAPNPCAGIKGQKSRREVYVSDADLIAAIGKVDPIVAGFLELCYLTGQRPGDVVRMRRADVQDGALWVSQAKRGAKVRIAVVGPLAALLERLTAGSVASVFLVRDERGQPFTLAALRKRFKRHGFAWQIRDLRAKAGTDSETARDAQTLLGHSAASTTDAYIRKRAGERAKPVMRTVRKDEG